MRGTFYNTIGETGEFLERSKEKVKKQETLILRFFRKHRRTSYTPFQVLYAISMVNSRFMNTPITSIRRAITNLTDSGLLVKRDKKRMERYGKRNHLWKLKVKQLRKK